MAYTGSRLEAIENRCKVLANDATSNFLDRTTLIVLANIVQEDLAIEGIFRKPSEVNVVSGQTEYPLSTNLMRIAFLDGTACTQPASGKVGIAATGHGFAIGDSITITGTTNYNGVHTLETQTTGNLLATTSIYIAETPATTAYATAAPNYGRILGVRYDDTEDWMYAAQSWAEFDTLQQNSSSLLSSYEPSAWIVMAEEEDKLYVWPAPTESITGGFHVLHTFVPQVFSETYNYTPKTPAMFDILYAYGVLKLRFERDYASKYAQTQALKFGGEYARLLKRLKGNRAHHKAGLEPYR